MDQKFEGSKQNRIARNCSGGFGRRGSWRCCDVSMGLEFQMDYALGRVRQFGRDRRGSVAIIFGLMSLVVMATVGVAIDISGSVPFRATLPSSADSAALVFRFRHVLPIPARYRANV